MYVRTLVFNQSNVLLAEIKEDARSASWLLNEQGQSPVKLPYTDDNCTPSVLAPGNRVLRQFSNGLVDWGGVMDQPRRRDETGVQIMAYTAERILSWRYTEAEKIYGSVSPGAIFQSLIETTNAESQTGIVIGDIDKSGAAIPRTYHAHNIWRAVKQLSKDSGEDFAVLPHYLDGILTFKAYWYAARGVDRSDKTHLIEGENLQRAHYNEQGVIGNRITLYGQGSTWDSTRPNAVEEDADSQADYGLRQYKTVRADLKTQGELNAAAPVILDDMKYFKRRLDLIVIDEGPAGFADYDIGDIAAVQCFLRGSPLWHINESRRIIGRTWQQDNTCRLITEAA